MGLLDDLRDQQLHDDDQGEGVEPKWTGMIPDELADQIADKVVLVMAEQVKVASKKRRFTCDKSFLGKKSYRYSVCFFNGLERLRVYTSSEPCGQSDPYFDDIIPEDNGYLYMFREHPNEGPDFCSVICGNIKNVKNVLAIAADKLAEEGLSCVCKVAKEYTYEEYTVTEIDFHIDIPCDENGVIITQGS